MTEDNTIRDKCIVEIVIPGIVGQIFKKMEERFNFGAEKEHAVKERIIDRFYAKTVACAE